MPEPKLEPIAPYEKFTEYEGWTGITGFAGGWVSGISMAKHLTAEPTRGSSHEQAQISKPEEAGIIFGPAVVLAATFAAASAFIRRREWHKRVNPEIIELRKDIEMIEDYSVG